MRDDVVHLLVGYDRETERLVYRRRIPFAAMKEIIKLVKLDLDDPDALAAYPLEYATASEVMGLMNEPKGPRTLDYFLEARSAALN